MRIILRFALFIVILVNQCSCAKDNHFRHKRKGLVNKNRRISDPQSTPFGFQIPLLSSLGFSIPRVQFDGSSLTIHSPAKKGVEHPAKSDVRDERNVDGRISTGGPRCTTPKGGSGRCVDLTGCPILVADLGLLRKSICFKENFLPGVCCPDDGVEILNLGTNNKDVTPPPSEIPQENFDENGVLIQPQGTTDSPNPFATSTLPSIEDFPVTEPPSSPGIDGEPLYIPGTTIECGVSKIPQSRIVGGNNTYEGQYPWMVAIFLHGKGRSEFWCGGALVTPIHVVTAAHCTLDGKKKPFKPSQFTARVGEWDLSDSDGYSQEYRITKVTAYPEFRPNGFYNDVAVFRLDQPVQFSEYIQPICLPTGNLRDRDLVGNYLVALGWGTTYYGGQEVSKLNEVALPVWTQTDCDNAYFQPITEVFMCAGFSEGGKDACQGDSGGPLMLYNKEAQNWALVGVVSFGNRCAEPGYPGVYTKLTHFLPWILANLN